MNAYAEKTVELARERDIYRIAMLNAGTAYQITLDRYVHGMRLTFDDEANLIYAVAEHVLDGGMWTW